MLNLVILLLSVVVRHLVEHRVAGHQIAQGKDDDHNTDQHGDHLEQAFEDILYHIVSSLFAVLWACSRPSDGTDGSERSHCVGCDQPITEMFRREGEPVMGMSQVPIREL